MRYGLLKRKRPGGCRERTGNDRRRAPIRPLPPPDEQRMRHRGYPVRRKIPAGRTASGKMRQSVPRRTEPSGLSGSLPSRPHVYNL
ncbi:hypothetical protein HMPREF9141_2093 [Prevotella multiformis DSM 16608]|uniref:Uncharacterized protein n=1 Tax=Prevotella multiformis DSM 16608 TaxID=888743 RepID=F0F926_9BACT|nr:hypothetical protein HMPREF9141_2093 [Prevotella multiformis DSM 16608]